MHLKRQKVPTSWPISRKGTKYIVKVASDLNKGVPILVFLRDMLGVAQNKKEVKKAIHEKNILINSSFARNEKQSVVLLDRVTIVPSKKTYVLRLNPLGKFEAHEVSESKANSKVSKIIGKKILKDKKVQLNLLDGRNVLSDVKCKIGDSIEFDFKNKKVVKCIPLEDKSRALVFLGKHTGKEGDITKVDRQKKMVELKTADGKIQVLTKQVMVHE